MKDPTLTSQNKSQFVYNEEQLVKVGPWLPSTAIRSLPQQLPAYTYINFSMKDNRTIKKKKSANRSTLLNSCSFWRTSPPQKNAHPSTSNKFDKIEPNNDSWTIRINPLFKAKIDIISSVAFPKVAFNRPPTANFKFTTYQKLYIISIFSTCFFCN